MPKRITLRPHLSLEELERRYKTAPNTATCRHYHLLWLVGRGHTITSTADTVGYTNSWARQVVAAYNNGGAEAAEPRRTGPKPGWVPPQSHLSEAQRSKLREALLGPAPDGGLWSGPKVGKWIEKETGQSVGSTVGWRYLRRLGFTIRRPRPRHRDVTVEEQEEFKKKSDGGS